MNNFDLSIIVPVYNEADIIIENLQKIKQVIENGNLNYELIVVNDGSTDKSYELIQSKFGILQNIHIINHQNNQGYSESIRTGLTIAKGDYVTYLDADLQYNPHDVIRFYRQAKHSSAFLIWGQSDKSQYPILRRIISRSHNILTRLLFGIPVTIDLNSIKLIKRSVLNDFKFSKRKEAIGLELLLHATRKNYKIIPLPIKVAKRIQGTSSFHLGLIFQSLKSMTSIWLNHRRVSTI